MDLHIEQLLEEYQKWRDGSYTFNVVTRIRHCFL